MKTIAGIVTLITGLLLIIILVPLSFSYIEYHEYGIRMRKSTGSINTSKVYGKGRYSVGPDNTFIKYQADAHYEQLKELGVFSSGESADSVGADVKVDIFFTFLLIKDEIIELHQELASSYRDSIISKTKAAIKTEAISIVFEEYFQNRTFVEKRFREAVEKSWNTKPTLHCTLDQFHLGRIHVPETVAATQLESKIQIERNDKERYLQQYQGELDKTSVEVNKIALEEATILRTAKAEANLIKVKAIVESKEILADATLNGTQLLFNATGIVSEDHMTSFTYIRTLANRKDIEFDISYLSSDNVLRTSVA